MTRVAWLNETMWTELFLENRDNLIQELDYIMGFLAEYREALAEQNADRLWQLLHEGKVCKEEVDGI
jgi:prephenate dehydrogenase